MSELMSRRGVSVAQLAVNRIGWFFREQPISDQGVDAIVEDVTVDLRDREEGTGRLLALQIKGGTSWFDERSEAGWWFRFSASHARRWLNLAIPVVVVLVDPDSEECYWQEISSATIVPAGETFKVDLPAAQTVATAAGAWRVLSSAAAQAAPARYDTSLAHLPPSARDLVTEISASSILDAQLLAYHLAEGRHNPAGTAQALLTSEPLWVTSHAPKSWEAIGQFAALHNARALAASAYERAADTGSHDASSRGKCLATAALQVIDEDRSRAKRLIGRAEDAGARPVVVAILRSMLNHPLGDAGPLELPIDLDTESEQSRSSAFIQGALTLQAHRSGDVAAALKHSELALLADPENSAVMEHRADMLLWSAQARLESGTSRLHDGLDLLQRSLTQRHAWDGPTRELTVRLAQACILDGQFHAALDICLPAPDGTATAADAHDPRVKRLALAAASGVAHRELVGRIASAMGDTPADRLARYRAGLIPADLEEIRTWLQADLEDAIASDDHLRIAQAGQSLAQLGVDTSALLQPYVDRSILAADTPQLLTALAVAHDNLNAALPQLRTLARASHQAALVLLARLRDADRTVDALAVCDQILLRRRDPDVVIARVELFIAQHDQAAEQAAMDAVTEFEGFPRERRRLMTFAAGAAAERGDWSLAAQRLQSVLALPGSTEDHEVWRLVLAYVNSGQVDRARDVIDDNQPEISTREEAGLWLRVHAMTGLTAGSAREALELAERLNDPEISTALLSLIVTATAGLDPSREADDDPELTERRQLALTAVPAALHVQAFESLNRLVEEYGDATGVTVLHGEPEDLAAQMIDLLRSRPTHDQVVADLVDQAQRSQLPVGFVAALTRRGYTTVLLERAIGVLPAASADDEEHDREVDVAAAWANRGVVADASSLLTSGALSQRDTVSAFSDVAVASATLRDIHRAGADIRGAAGSPGGMGYDHAGMTPVMTTLPASEYLRRLQRFSTLEALATTLSVRSVTTRTSLPDLADSPAHDPWTEPIELARELSCALWSDDLGLRRLAHQLGVASFGTPALLIALNEHQLLSAGPDQVHALISSAAAEVEALAVDRVVDLRLEAGAVLRLAQLGDWLPGAGAVVLSRPSWWAWTPGWWDEITALFKAVADHRADQLDAWQEAALVGAARAYQDPVVRSQVMCVLALLGRGVGDLSERLGESVARARVVARRLDLPDPVTGLLSVTDGLCGNMSDPDRERVADELERIARGAPG